MGAKYSIGRKEISEDNGDELPGGQNQQEQDNSDILNGSHGKYKVTRLHESKDVGDQQTFKATKNDEHLAVNNTAKGESSLEATVASNAPFFRNTSSDSPTSTKRYHPYDEVTDEQLTLNQKVKHDNSDVESKTADTPKLKVGKKTKEVKTEAEIVGSQTSSESVSKVKSPTVSPGAIIRGLLGKHNAEEQSVLNKDSKKVDKAGASNHIPKEKDGQKQHKVASAVDYISNNSELKQTTSAEHPKPAARYHNYDEITDDQLASNREAKNLEINKKLKIKVKPNEKIKKHKQEVTTNIESDINKKVPSSESKLKAGSESPSINSRYHPYDEITEEELSDNRKLMKEKKGDKSSEYSKQQSNQKEQDVTVDSEQTEYLNVAAIAATAMASHGSKEYRPVEQEDQEAEDNMKDVYAVPHKRRPHASPSKELNYIEVELNPTAPKPEVKQHYTAITYSNVVIKDGSLLLQES